MKSTEERHEYSRQYRLKNVERFRDSTRRYKEHRRVGQRMLNGRIIPGGETKRPFLGFCEVCGKPLSDKNKNYHHWEDDMPTLGMWLCRFCHVMAERIDDNLHGKYLKYKVEIERQFAIEQLKKIGIEVGDDW